MNRLAWVCGRVDGYGFPTVKQNPLLLVILRRWFEAAMFLLRLLDDLSLRQFNPCLAKVHEGLYPGVIRNSGHGESA